MTLNNNTVEVMYTDYGNKVLSRFPENEAIDKVIVSPYILSNNAKSSLNNRILTIRIPSICVDNFLFYRPAVKVYIGAQIAKHAIPSLKSSDLSKLISKGNLLDEDWITVLSNASKDSVADIYGLLIYLDSGGKFGNQLIRAYGDILSGFKRYDRDDKMLAEPIRQGKLPIHCRLSILSQVNKVPDVYKLVTHLYYTVYRHLYTSNFSEEQLNMMLKVRLNLNENKDLATIIVGDPVKNLYRQKRLTGV